MGEFQKTEITTDILNEDFVKYRNEGFIEVDQNFTYDYDISYHYNFYYPEGSNLTYTFMGYPVSKAAFAVKDNGSIEQVALYITMFDIDYFYQSMVEKFGDPGTLSISKFYLEQHGFKIPPETDNFDETSYDSLPKPKLTDFKNLRNINWYEVNSEANPIDTYIIVRNIKNYKLMNQNINEVEVLFRKAKD